MCSSDVLDGNLENITVFTVFVTLFVVLSETLLKILLNCSSDFSDNNLVNIIFTVCVILFVNLRLNVVIAVAIWPVTGQGVENTKWPAVLYS